METRGTRLRHKVSDFDKRVTPSLVVENPLLGGRASVPPEIRLEGEMLAWRRGPSEQEMEGFVEGAPVDHAIWEFLELRDAPETAFLDFAQRYGVLGIRSDGLPATARRGNYTTNIYPSPRQSDADPEVWWFQEPVAAWRMYSVALRTVLSFAIALRNNPGVALDSVIRDYGIDRYTWEWLGLPIASSEKDEVSELYVRWVGFLSPDFILTNLARCGPKYAQQWLTRHISTTWLEWAGLVPVISWTSGEPRMTLSLGSHGQAVALPDNMLFSVITAQLAALVTSPQFDRLDQCSVCGKLFVPGIKPGRHERSFCPDHKIEGERERKRRWARKQAAERRQVGQEEA